MLLKPRWTTLGQSRHQRGIPMPRCSSDRALKLTEDSEWRDLDLLEIGNGYQASSEPCIKVKKGLFRLVCAVTLWKALSHILNTVRQEYLGKRSTNPYQAAPGICFTTDVRNCSFSSHLSWKQVQSLLRSLLGRALFKNRWVSNQRLNIFY